MHWMVLVITLTSHFSSTNRCLACNMNTVSMTALQCDLMRKRGALHYYVCGHLIFMPLLCILEYISVPAFLKSLREYFIPERFRRNIDSKIANLLGYKSWSSVWNAGLNQVKKTAAMRGFGGSKQPSKATNMSIHYAGGGGYKKESPFFLLFFLSLSFFPHFLHSFYGNPILCLCHALFHKLAQEAVQQNSSRT